MHGGCLDGEGSRDAQLAALAARQHGGITLAQLQELGIARRTVERWVARGRLHRVHRGVYVVGHTAISDRGRWQCAVLAARAPAALSHRSAAALWGIRRQVRRIDVVSPRPRRPSGEVTFHRTASLDAVDVTHVDGIAVTTVARTVVDLGAMLTPAQLARVMYEAEYHRLLDVAAVRDCVERFAKRPNAHVIRSALALNQSGSAGTRSRLEDRFLSLVESWGIPPPLLNEQLTVGGETFELDAWWPKARLCVEVDGPGHGRSRAMRADARRDGVLAAAGIHVMRVTSNDLRNRRRQLRRTLAEALS